MKKYILLIAMLATSLCPLQAQVVTDGDDYEDEEEEVIVDENNEFTIRDKNGNEEVIDFPEAMDYDLDSLLNLYLSKTYLKQDSDCNMRDVNPTYSKEEYIERLSRLPTVMEMSYNDVVLKFIERYSGRLRQSVSYMLGAANFYMPIFEEALDAYGLPLELKYLPIIESALNPKAVSRVGATGLWQFMLATGKQYGLNVNSLVDDRRDPVKASYAAARYMQALYRIFGDWNLVIAAYNCGPENINKAIHRAGGVKDYWKIYPYLPSETRGYVPAFIAANYIMTYYSFHNICPMQTTLPEKTDTVVVNRNVHLQQIAAVLELDIEMLRSLNPQYRRDIVPGATEPSAIKLPLADTSRFIDNQDSIFAYNAAELLSKRAEVAINDETPTFTSNRKTTVRRTTTTRKRTTTTARRRTTTARKTTPAKKTTTARKR
ncbi:MAG: lytic transglycosylase domain-containing protein [Prevotella sp.]|nr:lytic transglycosylase domain-containing protein [Prevotella sp.]